MPDSFERTEEPKVTLHKIWTPDLTRSMGSLTILGVGLLLSWVLAYALIAAVTFVVFDPQDDPSGETYIIMMAAALAGPICWVPFFNRVRIRWLLEPGQQGPHITCNDSAFDFLAESKLAQLLRTPYPNAKEIAKTVAMFQPNVLVAANGTNIDDLKSEYAEQLHFEPLAIKKDSQLTINLVEDAYQLRGLEIEDDESDLRRYRVGNATLVCVALCILFVAAAYSFVSLIGEILIFAFPVLLLILLGIFRTIADTAWWVVPGGLIFRTHRSWRKHSSVGVLAPRTSPLFLDIRENYGIGISNGKPVRFTFDKWAGHLIVAAWLSLVPAPTIDEALSFAGPDAKATEE